MTKLKRKFRALPAAILCVLVIGATAAAVSQSHFLMLRRETGRPEVKVKLAGEVERAGARVAIDKVEAVRPGEILDWTINSVNEGDGSARDYKAIGQVPQGTTFVVGSTIADGSASVTYSIDGGKSFSAQPTIEEKQADGTVRRVPAPASMYTQVRYEWSDALAAGGKFSASYKVRVK